MANQKNHLTKKYGKVFDERVHIVAGQKFTIQMRVKKEYQSSYYFTAFCEIGDDFHFASDNNAEHAFNDLVKELNKRYTATWNRFILLSVDAPCREGKHASISIEYGIYDISEGPVKQYREVHIDEDDDADTTLGYIYTSDLFNRKCGCDQSVEVLIPYEKETVEKIKVILNAINILRDRIAVLMKTDVNRLFAAIVPDNLLVHKDSDQ